MRDILAALEADELIGNLWEEEVTIIEEIAEVLERRQKEKLPALRDNVEVKFCVMLKHTPLKRLMNYYMQELLLIQIGWE